MSRLWPEEALVFATCFISGFVVLAIEIASFRLLAPFFGASVYVNGIVINTILLALALGYLLGGQIADRCSSARMPYFLMLMSALYLALALLVSSPLLHAAARLPLVYGATVTMVAMFFLPMTLLACVPPYFIKQLSCAGPVGMASGRVYAFSTVGSIAGGVLTTFGLLPFLGSRITFQVATALLIANAAAGLARSNKQAILALLLLPLPFVSVPRTCECLHREESAYNVITINESNDVLYLKLNDGFGHHSQTLDPETMLSDEYYDSFLLAPMMSKARRILVLGNGAGTSMMQTAHFFPAAIDGVEIDNRLTTLGRRYFGLRTSDSRRIFGGDARVFIARSGLRYDAIYVDVYAGGPYIPFHVATKEFYQQLRRSLASGGVVAINLPFYAEGTMLGDRLLNTIAGVFPVTYVWNGMAYAMVSPAGIELMKHRLEANAFAPALKALGTGALAGLRPVSYLPEEGVFTDDLAPIEAMTHDLLEHRGDRGRKTMD